MLLDYNIGKEKTFLLVLICISESRNTLFHQRNLYKYIYSNMKNAAKPIFFFYRSLAETSSTYIRVWNLYHNLFCGFYSIQRNVLSTAISQWMLIDSNKILQFQLFPPYTIHIKKNTFSVISTCVNLKWVTSHWPLLVM